MLSRKMKKVLASVAAVSMLATVLAQPLSAAAAASDNMLGQCDFDKNVGLPWHICESGTAKLKFDISGGAYNIEIVNPGGLSNGGESRWDCQFRHRGLKITSGHKYEVKFQITSDTKGEFYTKIGNLEGDTEIWNGDKTDGQKSWKHLPIAAGETIDFEATFTADATVEVAEWAFHFGGDGEYAPANGCFPAGTKLTFDNMSLKDLTDPSNVWIAAEVYEKKDLVANQVGYITGLQKQATIAFFTGTDDPDTPGDDRTPATVSSGKEWVLKNKSGTTVASGTTTPKGSDKDSGNYVHIIDFSSYDTAGTGYYLECDGKKSVPFDIGDNVYDGLLEDSLNYFYLNRSADKIESTYITSGDKSKLARPAGHTSDNAYIQSEWVYSYAIDGSDVEKGKTQDVTGGWYDAGDYGKYVVNGGISLWTLLNIYEKSLANKSEAKYADGTVSIPEKSNGDPDLLDEARVEMEWFLTMIVKDGAQKGMAYHKMHDFKWTGLAVTPADSAANDELYRIIKPPSTAATLNLAACGAQAYRLWKDVDSSFAEECLEAAKNAYVAAQKNPDEPAPLDQNKGGGPYGDTQFSDEFHWAAIELFLATGESTYLDDAKKLSHYLECPDTLIGGENKGDIGSFNWGNTAALGTISLITAYNNDNEYVTKDMYELAADNILKTSDIFIELEESQGYGVPFGQSDMTVGSEKDGDLVKFVGYTWGSNSFVVNNAIVMATAYSLTHDAKYASGASTAMDYIFGRNPMEYSYVSGYGEHALTNPHHRYWSNQIDENLPAAPSGVLSGGPNSGMQDPYIKGAGFAFGTTPPQLCYLDHVEAWSVNECTINWNAPIVWMADFFEQYTDETNKFKHKIGGGTTEPDAKYGDINLDGNVTAADVITFTKHFLGTTLKGQALINADVTADGQVALTDLATLKQFVVGDKVGGGRLVR